MMNMDKELREIIRHLTYASRLRTYPNGKNLPVKKSVTLNQVGKCLEWIEYFLRDYLEGKGRKKEYIAIVKCRNEIEDLYKKRERNKTAIRS